MTEKATVDVEAFCNRYFWADPDDRRGIREEFEATVAALVESRDALSVKCDGLEGHYQELDYMLDEVKAERDAAIAQLLPLMIERDQALKDCEDLSALLSQRCGCVLANVSDGPHPELAAKDRMYATEVCWYHRFVHEESRRLASQNAELCAAFIGGGLCSNQPAHWCRHCLVWGIDPEPIAHKPDCIITRLEEK